MVLGGGERLRVLGVVGRGVILARRSLRGRLVRVNCSIARSAISHSVGRLHLIGDRSTGKGCHCITASTRDLGGSADRCGSIFMGSIGDISCTLGGIMVGYCSNVTSDTYIVLSGVFRSVVLNSLTNSSAVVVIAGDRRRSRVLISGVGGVLWLTILCTWVFAR